MFVNGRPSAAVGFIIITTIFLSSCLSLGTEAADGAGALPAEPLPPSEEDAGPELLPMLAEAAEPAAGSAAFAVRLPLPEPVFRAPAAPAAVKPKPKPERELLKDVPASGDETSPEIGPEPGSEIAAAPVPEVEERSEPEPSPVAAPEPEPEPEPVIKAESEPEPDPAEKTAPSPAAPAAPAAADRASEAEAEAPVREVFVYGIEDEGWILEGIYGEDGSAADGLRFNGREYAGGRTLFSLYPLRTDIYVAHFGRTDYSSGKHEGRVLRLKVTEERPSSPGDDPPGEDAVPETEAAPEAAPAVIQAEPDQAQAEDALSPNALAARAEKFAAAGQCRMAAELLEDGLEEVSWMEQDLILFRLAEIYQDCGGVRDERKAADIYRRIVDYYPVSIYWTLSRERIAYLERYFIHIR